MKSLRVINKRDATILKEPEDDFLSKVVKYIPTEIIGAYTAFRAIIMPDKEELLESISRKFPNKEAFEKLTEELGKEKMEEFVNMLQYGDSSNHMKFAIAFYVGLILTPIYKFRTLRDPRLETPYYQIIISTLAFTVWVFAFGDYFEKTFAWYDHDIAAISLIVFSLIVPLIEDFFIKKPPKI